MESTVAEEVSESPLAQEEAKNEATIIAGDDGNMENGKNPVLVAVVAAAEVASIISPAKTVESPQEIKNMKNEKKKKQKKEVQVSNTKKPFIFYLNRAKRYINEFNEVELCGLGMAIPTVVTIAEILKRNGFAIQKDCLAMKTGIMTSTVLSTQEDRKGRQIEKAKIEIVLGKAEKFGAMNAVVTPKKAAD
ncbi:DNA/RNA-binding protein Alba-like protein [Gossypium australe]|uniref:DNA/RNA-binding protein Alba-like protein n=1 Tax=Gossypium australe TaxID=47621 RepID=A0A5B6WU30_9ROSI|nr:DNA/RNA-binding protein Alba-like protein [Gossypium australe]